jgi:hypothetical protein
LPSPETDPDASGDRFPGTDKCCCAGGCGLEVAVVVVVVVVVAAAAAVAGRPFRELERLVLPVLSSSSLNDAIAGGGLIARPDLLPGLLITVRKLI